MMPMAGGATRLSWFRASVDIMQEILIQLSFLLAILSNSVSQLPEAVAETKTFYTLEAQVTAYSEIDSCHSGKDCLMASGKRAYIGAAACSRKIPLFTMIVIDGKEYLCEDRTALWVEKKYPNTIDLFFGFGADAHKRALNFGRQTKSIDIYENTTINTK